MWLIVVPWLLAAIRPVTRTRSFFGFLALTSAAVLLSTRLDPSLRTVIQVGIAISWAAAFMFSEELHLADLTPDEVVLDNHIRGLVRKTDDAVGQLADDHLEVVLNRAARLDHRWRQVVTLLQASDESTPPMTQPRESVVLAARHYWHDVRNRRVIGRRPMSGPWDFDMYLHVQFDRRSVSSADEGRSIADEIRHSRAPNSEWGHIRDLLIDVITEPDQSVLLAPATGPHGGDMRASRLHEAWRIAQAKYRPGSALPDDYERGDRVSEND